MPLTKISRSILHPLPVFSFFLVWHIFPCTTAIFDALSQRCAVNSASGIPCSTFTAFHLIFSMLPCQSPTPPSAARHSCEMVVNAPDNEQRPLTCGLPKCLIYIQGRLIKRGGRGGPTPRKQQQVDAERLFPSWPRCGFGSRP
ncbi:hypothetical protein F4778DRAFT_739696 [Xylariomycetidae sp. FL2044]|nr:hypothetical protein F4778DRAFT_739696 [Xylariomycetidae sp. FL2044]